MTRRRRSSLSPLSTPAYEEKDVKVMRIAASDVAAIAGFHEWVDVRELFVDRLLYQDLEHVLHADADNLGLELEDRRQRSERLLAKAGDVELQTVRERAGNASAIATVRDAKALRDKAKSLLKKAEASKKLSKEEARELEDDLRHDINTQFGTRNEEVALRVYERRSGTEVMCSNDRYLVWPFPGARHGDDIPDGAPDPPQELAKGWNKTQNRRLKHARFASQAAATATVAADPDPTFAPAVARCLAELPVRAVLESVIERVLSIASSKDVETASAAVDLTGVSAERGEGVKGVDPSLDKSDCISNGNRRQLAPAVPWPKWRREVSPAKGWWSSTDAAGTHWCGQPGLWFPESLTPRQRDAVRTAAAELGLRHDLVAGKAVVVWENSAAGAAAAAATASVTPEATRSARRALALSSCVPRGSDGQCMSLLDETGAPSTPGQGRSLGNGSSVVVEPEAGKGTGHRVSERGTGGRGSGSLRALNEDSEVGVMCKVAERSSTVVTEAVATEGRGKEARTSVPHQTEVDTIVPSVSGAADIAAAAAAALMSPEIGNGLQNGEAGVEAVYAWGEGPASAAATTSGSASTQEPEEPSSDDTAGVGLSTAANQTPSVWCREPHVGTPETEKIVAELPVTRRASMISDFSDGREGIASEEAGAWEGKVVESAGVDDRKKACFVIVGAVDGVVEELTTARDDADTWETRRVVVEVKNRMNKVMDPPPLYDQIQLVTYMLMIGATAGDLVQFVKTRSRSKKGRDRNRGSSADEMGRDKAAGGVAAVAEEDVTVSRVELDCRRYHHKRQWQETILPRLYAFARMVYRFRSDDLLRWRFLLATPEEQREMLVECCPYLGDVIRHTLPRANPTARDVMCLEQATVETVAACPSSEFSSGAASREQKKRNRENPMGGNSPESIMIGGVEESGSSTAATVSPVRKRGKGEEGMTLERVGVISQSCKGK